MVLSYLEFKQYVKNMRLANFRDFAKIINNLDEFYDENNFKFFYPKNIFNEKEIELILFLEDGFIKIKKEKVGTYVFEHNYCKVLSKKLVSIDYTSGYIGHHILDIKCDNGVNLKFNDLEDSNDDWEQDYSKLIRELYKIM